ncbi:MAG: methyl-accepting chemotaxis protein [Magnetococcales bacterium]|nr:methyl-accepting chemotaxis protein [Magnetococcales bacterium]
MTDRPVQHPGADADGGGNPSSPMPQRGVNIIPPVGTHKECGNCSAMVLDQFAKSFDKSARRWELVVYPSLFAFIILAMYGFFLIYSLTQDIRIMSHSIDPQMGRNMGSLSSNIGSLSNNIELMSNYLEYISDNMETMSVDMQTMAENIDTMTDSVSGMSGNVKQMAGTMTEMSGRVSEMAVKLDTLGPMTANVAIMSQAMRVITGSMNRMGYDMNNAARPMSFINRFMPW